MEKLHLERLAAKDLLLEIDDLLTELKTQEGNEEIDRLFEEYMETQSKIEELISDSHYIEWLDQFTKKNDHFTDESWMAYRNNILGDVDKKQISNLYYFYIAIRQYAKLNNITSGSYHSYYVKFNDFYFDISRTPDGNHTETCVWRYKSYKHEDDLNKRFYFIDFNEIINNFGQYKLNQVSKQLCILSSLAKTIHKNGVPVKSIIDTVDSTLTSVSQIEDEPKKLTRKQCN